MKKYLVKSAKPVTVRVGTQQESEHKIFKQGEVFETSEAFAADLVAQGFVAEHTAEQALPAAKATTTGKTKEASK